MNNLIANGTNGANGGAITLNSPGAISGTMIEATANGGGNGGPVTSHSYTFTLSTQNGNGNSIETLAYGGGTLGHVSINTSSPAKFVVGTGGNATGNGTLGYINGTTNSGGTNGNGGGGGGGGGGNNGNGTANGGSGFGFGLGNGNGLATALTANNNNLGNIALNNALLASLAGFNNDEDFVFNSKTPTDITEVFQYASEDQSNVHTGYVDQDEYRKRIRQLIAGTKTFANELTADENATLVKNGVTIASADATRLGANYFNIDKGNVVFNPTHDIVVGTHDGEVHIAGGSHVFVMESGHDVAVYNLHQNGKGKVYVVSGNQKLTIGTAQMVVLSRQSAKDFDGLNGEMKIISYRSVRPVELQNGVRAFIGEFSIPSAFASVIPLNKMLKSDETQDKVAVDRILKSQVVLTSMMGTGSPFENGQPAR
jgi:hypothetical protein